MIYPSAGHWRVMLHPCNSRDLPDSQRGSFAVPRASCTIAARSPAAMAALSSNRLFAARSTNGCFRAIQPNFANFAPCAQPSFTPHAREQGAERRRASPGRPPARRLGWAGRRARRVRASCRDKARWLDSRIAAPRPVDPRLGLATYPEHAAMLNACLWRNAPRHGDCVGLGAEHEGYAPVAAIKRAGSTVGSLHRGAPILGAVRRRMHPADPRSSIQGVTRRGTARPCLANFLLAPCPDSD